MTGGTGLVGQALGEKLSFKNYKIHLLCRKTETAFPYPCKKFSWPDVKLPPPQEAFSEKEDYGIIHLAGEPIAQWPWTKHKKEKIYSSRVEGTKKLVSSLKHLAHPPQFFISASAIGRYGDQGEKELTESSPVTDQNLFLQKVCKDWEEEALKASSLYRTLVFRLGIVISCKKGFLREQLRLPLIPLIINKRTNWLSWISLEDLSSMLLWAIENKQTKGIYNAVSPNPVSLKKFYRELAKQTKYKKLKIPTPLFLMKAAGGEMTKNLLASCRAFPEKALSEGFSFKQAELEGVLKNLI